MIENKQLYLERKHVFKVKKPNMDWDSKCGSMFLHSHNE